MSRVCLLRSFWPVLIVISLMLLPLGCGDDKSTQPEPDPDLTLSLSSKSGLIEMVVQNDGGPMNQPACLTAHFYDGHADSMFVTVPAGSSMTCPISNVHGSVLVNCDEWDLEAEAGNGLQNYFAGMLSAIDLNSLVPSPLTVNTVVLCTYTTYLDQIHSSPPTVSFTPTDSGLIMTTQFTNLAGRLRSTSPGGLCPDLTGSVSISSIVVKTNILFDESVGPEVTLGSSHSTVNGMTININGLLGFLAEWIISFVQSSFVSGLADTIESSIGTQVGSDLSGLIVVRCGCTD